MKNMINCGKCWKPFVFAIGLRVKIWRIAKNMIKLQKYDKWSKIWRIEQKYEEMTKIWWMNKNMISCENWAKSSENPLYLRSDWELLKWTKPENMIKWQNMIIEQKYEEMTKIWWERQKYDEWLKMIKKHFVYAIGLTGMAKGQNYDKSAKLW